MSEVIWHSLSNECDHDGGWIEGLISVGGNLA